MAEKPGRPGKKNVCLAIVSLKNTRLKAKQLKKQVHIKKTMPLAWYNPDDTSIKPTRMPQSTTH